MNKQEKKTKQLGMNPGTASNRLKKEVMFSLVKQTGRDFCFQCGEKIETIKEFSIEHKKPWLDSKNPEELYFNLDNIAFSHLKCNVSAGRQPEKGKFAHPSVSAYNRGCRCDKCKKCNTDKKRMDRARRKT